MNYQTYEVFGFFTSGTSTHELIFQKLNEKFLQNSPEKNDLLKKDFVFFFISSNKIIDD